MSAVFSIPLLRTLDLFLYVSNCEKKKTGNRNVENWKDSYSTRLASGTM